MKKTIIFILILIIFVLSAIGFHFYRKYQEIQNTLYKMHYEYLTVGGNQLIKADSWINENGNWWIHGDALIKYTDKGIRYSKSGNRIYIPKKSLDMPLETDALSQWSKENIKEINLPVRHIKKKKYVSMSQIEAICPIRHKHFEKTGVHFLFSSSDEIRLGKAKETFSLTAGEKIGNFVLGEVKKGETFYFASQSGEKILIISENGLVGYMQGKGNWTHEKINIKNKPLRELRKKSEIPLPLRLSWQQVSKYKHFQGEMEFGPEKGIDIVSPTWFELNVDGIVLNRADWNYVKAAHKKNIKVWPIFTNRFNPDWTHELLQDEVLMNRAISQIILYCALYDLDGINIDFENMYLKDKDRFSNFVRQLSQKLQSQGMTVSIDVTVPWGSDRWSKVYDRKTLAQFVDYVMLMAYDEHWASSPRAGSVASAPWVEKGIVKTLELVPREKLVLGIPFYSRIWTQSSGGKVKSKAVGRKGQQIWLNKTNAPIIFDEKTGQNYGEFEKNGSKERLWLEDSLSLAMRINLAKKYDLPGIAGWSQTFTTKEVWDQIQKSYGRR